MFASSLLHAILSSPVFRLWRCTPLLILFACQVPAAESPNGENELIDVAAIVSKNDSLVTDLKSRLQNGDLILRTGTDFSSEQVKNLSKQDKSYSHGGIAVWDSGYWKVYHIEPDYYHINDKVRKENLDTFLVRAHNSGFALARYRLDSAETVSLLNYLDTQYRKGVSFDIHFELQTDQYLYCSEMIKKGLAKATHNRIVIEAQPLDDRSKYKLIKQHFKLQEKQFAHRPIVPIDRLYLHKDCQLIKRYIYRL